MYSLPAPFNFFTGRRAADAGALKRRACRPSHVRSIHVSAGVGNEEERLTYRAGIGVRGESGGNDMLLACRYRGHRRGA
ncbi:MAG: hypothetical protein QOJ61_1407 [Mycobacterium sp.]|nr:hypothetical protein [Mycobacterium sp.]